MKAEVFCTIAYRDGFTIYVYCASYIKTKVMCACFILFSLGVYVFSQFSILNKLVLKLSIKVSLGFCVLQGLE